MDPRHAPKDKHGLLKKEEEALITIMKERALLRCKLKQKQYYECVKDRTLTVIFACRKSWNELNECLNEHTSERALNDIKEKWVKNGKPKVGTENGLRIPVKFLDDE